MITEIFHYVNLPVDDPEIGPTIIFQDVSPIYLKVNFQQWCDIGLAEVGTSRQSETVAIKHIKTEFLGLIDAVYCIARSMKDDNSEEDMKIPIRYYIDNYYRRDVKPNEIIPPPDFCQAFFREISATSIKSLLWILLELVLVHHSKHEYHLDEPNILDLYERYGAIILTAHDWKKITKDYHRSQETSRPKGNKGRT